VYLQYLEPVEESLRQLLPEILERGDTEADILPLLSKEAHDGGLYSVALREVAVPEDSEPRAVHLGDLVSEAA
jgi:hypothetical protein